MGILDKTLRELYQETISWLHQNFSIFDQYDLSVTPWLEPILLIIAGCGAIYLLFLAMIFIIRGLAYFCFKMDQVAHWLAGLQKDQKAPPKLVHVREFERWRVQGYEPNPRKAAGRRREWRRKQISPRELREIEEKNRSRL